MKRGDKVRIVRLPRGLKDDEFMQTRRIFKLCLGRTFRVMGFWRGDGFHGDWPELHVGRVVGDFACAHSIWIEPRLVEVVGSTRRVQRV